MVDEVHDDGRADCSCDFYLAIRVPAAAGCQPTERHRDALHPIARGIDDRRVTFDRAGVIPRPQCSLPPPLPYLSLPVHQIRRFAILEILRGESVDSLSVIVYPGRRPAADCGEVTLHPPSLLTTPTAGPTTPTPSPGRLVEWKEGSSVPREGD